MLKTALDTFYVISPILIISGIGYISAKNNWIKDEGSNALIKIVFYVGLPSLLIDEISRSSLSQLLSLKGPYIVSFTALLVALLGYYTASIKKLPANQKGVWAQGSFRANMAFVGFPIAINAMGDVGVQYCSMILVIAVPVFNILSVFFLFLPNRDASGKIPIKKMLNGILTNPLVIACFIGIFFSIINSMKIEWIEYLYSGIEPVADKTLQVLRNITLGSALLALGSKLEIVKSLKLFLPNFLPVFYKLILAPLIGGVLLYLFGAEPNDFMAAILLLASPVAVLSYIMAAEMGGDRELAANLVLTTTFFSFISFSIILFILGLIGIWTPSN